MMRMLAIALLLCSTAWAQSISVTTPGSGNYPNGQAITDLAYVGSVKRLKATCSGVSSVTFALSRNGGSTWSELASGVSVDGGAAIYDWTVTGPASDAAVIRVTDDGSSTADSSETFEIRSPGSGAVATAAFRYTTHDGVAFSGTHDIDVCAFSTGPKGSNGDGIARIDVSINGAEPTSIGSRTQFATLGPFRLYCYRHTIDAKDYADGPVTVDVTAVPTAGTSRVLPQVTLYANSGGTYTGSTVYVHGGNGDDATGDGSEVNPYATIQKALNVVTGGGDVIILSEGTYSIGFLNATPAARLTPTYVTLRPAEGLLRENVILAASIPGQAMAPRIPYLRISGVAIDLRHEWSVTAIDGKKPWLDNCYVWNSLAPSESGSPVSIADRVSNCRIHQTYHGISALKHAEGNEVSASYYDYNQKCIAAINNTVYDVSYVMGHRYSVSASTAAVHNVDGTVYDGAEIVTAAEWPTTGPWSGLNLLLEKDTANSRWKVTITAPDSGDVLVYQNTAQYEKSSLSDVTYSLVSNESDTDQFAAYPSTVRTPGPHIDLNQYFDGAVPDDNRLVYGLDATSAGAQNLFLQGAMTNSAFVDHLYRDIVVPGSSVSSQLAYGNPFSGLLLQNLRWAAQTFAPRTDLATSTGVVGRYDNVIRDCHFNPSTYAALVANRSVPYDICESGCVLYESGVSDVLDDHEDPGDPQDPPSDGRYLLLMRSE